MPSRYKYYLVGGLIAIAFAAGRYTLPAKIVTEIKTVEVKDTSTDIDKNEHKTIVINKKPDGETTTTITDNTATDETQKIVDTTQSDNRTEVTYAHDGVTISALAGIDVTHPGAGLSYGAAISKPVLGPISIGLWGFTSGTFGASVGIKF